MDFATLLRQRASNLPYDERRALYAAFRARVREFEASLEGDARRRQGQSYSSALEAAIREIEAEQTDAVHPGAEVEARLSMPASSPSEPRVSGRRMTFDAGNTTGRPPGPETAYPPARRKGGVVRLVLAALLGCSAGVGGLMAYEAVTRTAGNALVERYAEGRASSAKNVEMVRTLRGAVEDHRLGNGSFPTTAGAWVAFAAIAETVPSLKAALGRIEGPKERLLYRGNGSDYKLIVHQSGDCFIVKLDRPEMVDPARDAGPVDCYAYGFWTSGAAAW